MLVVAACVARAAELVYEGAVPDDGLDHFFVPFDVPAGVAEVEVAVEVLPRGDVDVVLDCGVDGPAGSLGWGGGNLEPAVIGGDASSRSYLRAAPEAGTWRVVLGEALMPPEGADYRVVITLRDAPTLAPQPERAPYAAAPALDRTARWYAGDLHVHSVESGDASPSIDAVAALAVARGLDFVVLTDHNTVSQADFLVDAQGRWPDLLLVPGIEFTTYDGHAGAFGATEWVDHRIGQPGATIEAAADAVHRQGALFVVNHPNLDLGDLCLGCAWAHALDPDQIDAIEIVTGGYAPAGGLFYDDNVALWESWLATGARVAPVGGSDDHRAGVDLGPTDSPIGSPTTLIWASELSVAGLTAGLAAGRTVVKLQGPDDPMVELWPASGDPGGDPDDRAPLVATVTGGAGARLEWWVDGSVARVDDVTSDVFQASLHIDAPPAGSRVRAVLVDEQPRVVTGVWWVADAAPAGCGCGAVGGAPPWPVAAVALLARRRRVAR